jgi:DnaB-like helicase N terminal domain
MAFHGTSICELQAGRDHRDIARPLPHNLDAERSILGAIVLNNEVLKAVVERLSPEDFFLPQHRHLFECMIELARNSQPIDYVTMMELLERRGRLQGAGGIAYVSQLGESQPRATNVAHFAGIVKEKSRLRKLAFCAEAIQKQALEATEDSQTLLARASETIVGLSTPDCRPQEIFQADMPEDVLDGRLGEICESRLVGLPRSYAWISLVCAAGVLVPQQSKLRTNLYGCVVGPVGSGKSVSTTRAPAILGIEKPRLEKTLAGSAEGLLEKISDANGDTRLLMPDELGHLLTKARIDCASFPYVLNTAFYISDFELTMARGKKISVNVALSILGGIVAENFESCFSSATTSGLHDRFIFGLNPSPFSYVYRPLDCGPESTEPCAVEIAGDVWEARDEWISNIAGVTPRVAEQALRVAVIGAAFSGRRVLHARHLSAARAFGEYQARVRQKLAPNPGENPDARCAFAILRALEHGEWYLRREIGRKIHADRFGPNVFERAVRGLEATGEIHLDNRKPARIRRVGSGGVTW